MKDIIEFSRNNGSDVIGVGVSNLPLIKFLLDRGVNVTARDKKTAEELGEPAKELQRLGVKLLAGNDYLSDLGKGSVFRTPGMRHDVPEIEAAVRSGACLTSEMELFFSLTKAELIGITGSDGKTTTTTLISLILSESAKRNGNNIYLGGNIGRPLLPSVESMTSSDIAVVELSSFQLQTMRQSPRRAVITNITPNHLNWHLDMEEYTDAKKNIFRHGAEYLVVNADNSITEKAGEEVMRLGIKVVFFSSSMDSYDKVSHFGGDAVFIKDGYIVFSDGKYEDRVLRVSDIKIPGRHNIENYMAAIAATRGMVTNSDVVKVAKEFSGVEHRIELVRELNGVKYYNSSIDSTPSRTAAALAALSEKAVVICGGYDKNIPFEPLARALNERASAVVLTGATAEKIKDAIDKSGSKINVAVRKQFESAVKYAAELAKAQGAKAVILSPACASFDAFKNFEERGNVFKEIVNNLK